MLESAFRLLGYKVSKINLDVNDHFNHQNAKFGQQIEVTQGLDPDNKLFVEVSLAVTITSEDKLFSMYVLLKGGFQASEDIEPALFEKMSRQNAPAVLFPLLRAIVVSYTSQAGLPPIILPLVNFATQLTPFEPVSE